MNHLSLMFPEGEMHVAAQIELQMECTNEGILCKKYKFSDIKRRNLGGAISGHEYRSWMTGYCAPL